MALRALAQPWASCGAAVGLGWALGAGKVAACSGEELVMGKGRSRVAEQVKPLLRLLKGWEVKAGIAEQRINGVQSRAGGRAGLKGSQEGAPADWGLEEAF